MKYLSFKKNVEKYKLTNEAIFNVKIKESLKLMNITECGKYMRDDKFTTPSGIVNLHPSVGTHWVLYTNKFSFDSYGCPPPLNRMSFIKSGIYSEYQIQKNDSHCAAFCSYILFLRHLIGYKNAILILYYQVFMNNKWRKLILIQLNIKLYNLIKILRIRAASQIRNRVASRTKNRTKNNYQKIGENL